MAVYERLYRSYDGPRTPDAARVMVIPRYAIQDAFQSRMFTSLFVGGLLPVLLGMVVLYLPHNLEAVQMLQVPAEVVDTVVASVFDVFLRVQTGFAFFIVLMQAPLVVASDLRNNALPLYLSRPFSRRDYVLGNFLTLAIPLSILTWIPGLLLFGFQCYLMGLEWTVAHLRVGLGMFAGAWLFLTFMSLLGLAISAWSRSKAVARGTIASIFFFMAGLGAIVDDVLKTHWGVLLSIPQLTDRLYAGLMGVERSRPIPLEVAVLVMVGYSLAAVALLYRQIRAYEVVR